MSIAGHPVSSAVRTMNVTAGIKRKRQAAPTETRKRRARESPHAEVNEMEDESPRSDDVNQEQGTSDSNEEEGSEVEEGSLENLEESSNGESDDEDDRIYEDEEFPWLKHIIITIKADGPANSPQIGFCTAKLIDRGSIRAKFYGEMDEPSHDTANVALGLFNRWGCLKPEFLNHPVKKGTGVWGPEMNEGRFLLIETLSIQNKYQRKGYGKKLFEQVWEKAANSGCDFAIVWATVINTSDLEAERSKLSSSEGELLYQGKQNGLEDFWRAMGFRRIGSSPFFCLAKDPKHASHSLLSQDDYQRPAVLAFSARADNQDFPFVDLVYDRNAVEQKYNDAETKEFLAARLQSHPATDLDWLSVDRHGNTILHTLARGCKAEALTWLLALPFADNLLSVRNLEGETPLEALETVLESGRTAKEIWFLDAFSGFASHQVECLKQLKRLKNPSPIEINRLAFGCTCGLCLGGFLSPRVAFALKCQGEICHDMLNVGLDYTSSGISWCECWNHIFKHLPPSVKCSLRTNKSMRQGFTNVLMYIARTLQAKMVPTSDNILHIQQADSNEWPSYTQFYLQRGGTVHAVLQACFDCAIDEDQYLGNGEHHTTFQSDIDVLPACRNDGEFLVCRQQCRRLEGLPEEAALL